MKENGEERNVEMMDVYNEVASILVPRYTKRALG
jgi:hypothetical protein